MFYYVPRSLIYNSQNLERTQLSLNGRMDTENVVCLYNGLLLSILKQWIHEILRQTFGSGKYHPTWGNSFTKEHTWNAVTDKWISAQKLWIPKTQLTYQIIPKKKEGEGPGPGGLMQHCREWPGHRSGRGLIGEWAEGRGLMGLMGRGKTGKGKSFGI